MKKRRVICSVLLAVVSAALIGTGLFRIVMMYQEYRENMLDYESRNLNSIVSANARSLDRTLEEYMGQVETFAARPEVISAENDYLASEEMNGENDSEDTEGSDSESYSLDSDESYESYIEYNSLTLTSGEMSGEEGSQASGEMNAMEQLMNRNNLFRPNVTYCVGVYDEEGVFLASSAWNFPIRGEEQDEMLADGFYLRKDDAGEFWFIFQAYSEQGLLYELAEPVQVMFSEHVNETDIGRRGYLFLLDRDCGVFSYAGVYENVTTDVKTLTEDFSGINLSALEELSQTEEMSQTAYKVYHYPWISPDGEKKATDETLVVTYPLDAGGLVMGAAVCFSEFDSFITVTLNQVTWFIIMEIGGVLILLAMAAWMVIINRRSTLELAAVKERAEFMEEINRQQQSLAHSERLQQLGVMTSGIVHEFNNMLTPIMGQSLLLLEELADQEESDQFANALDIYEASENAREVLKRMSSMSKADADIGFSVVNLCTLLEKTMNLAAMAKDPHIEQILKLPEEPIFVSGNEQLLTQAFLNLCINACQAMGTQGTLTVSAMVEQRVSGRVYARVDVMDTGAGIPEEFLGSIYDPFFTTKGQQGTGLGLSICQKIIETHKGTISVANRETGGAVFTVSLPVVDFPEE